MLARCIVALPRRCAATLRGFLDATCRLVCYSDPNAPPCAAGVGMHAVELLGAVSMPAFAALAGVRDRSLPSPRALRQVALRTTVLMGTALLLTCHSRLHGGVWWFYRYMVFPKQQGRLKAVRYHRRRPLAGTLNSTCVLALQTDHLPPPPCLVADIHSPNDSQPFSQPAREYFVMHAWFMVALPS